MSTHPVESLSAFLDDELADVERRGVAAHLAACPSCARRLRELAAVDALARGFPPAGAPDGYLEALPGRVRQRIRADRPASTRAPWVWPLAAGLALAVLAPIILRQQRSQDPLPHEAPSTAMEPSAPTTAMPEQRQEGAAARRSAATPQDERRYAAPEPKTRERFAAAPPPAARANEHDRAAQGTSPAAAAGLVDAPPMAAPPAEPEALAAAGRRKEERAESAGVLERSDAAPALKKADAAGSAADAPRRNAATPQDERRAEAEKAFRDNASLPATTSGEALAAREAWRRFASLHPAGPRADEGRVRFIEAAVAAFRLTRDEGDRAIAEREARLYLANPGARQASRVRDALRRLER